MGKKEQAKLNYIKYRPHLLKTMAKYNIPIEEISDTALSPGQVQ